MTKTTSRTRFEVTEQMLDVVGDYGARSGSEAEAREGLRYFFPKLTTKQIDAVLARWRREMRESGHEVAW